MQGVEKIDGIIYRAGIYITIYLTTI